MWKLAILIIILIIIILISIKNPYPKAQRGGHTPLTINDKSELLAAMKMVHQIFKERNIPYFLAFGSVLGALRHKGFIPWDDDIDLLFFRKDIPRVREALKVIEKKYKIEETWKLFKIHPTDNTYIDFFPVEVIDGKVIRCRVDNDTDKCDEVKMHWWTSWFRFKKDLLLPAKLYKFEDTEFYGPAQGLKLAKFWYGNDCMTVCKSRFHEDGSYNWGSPKKMSCKELEKRFKNT